VCCKVSGLVTEAEWGRWTPDDLRRYFDVVLEAFGAERLMFGSDWPVALLASGYQRWVETVEAWTAGLTEMEREGIWGGNAVRVYGL
jgi:L-fuconolactonase